MSEMWKELHAEYRLNQGERQTTGTRVFVRDDRNGDIAPAALPVVGTGTMVNTGGTAIAGCLLRDIESFYVNGHGGTPAMRCEYSTEDSTFSSSGNAVPVDDEAESFEISGSLETFNPDPNVADGDYWTWGSSNQVEQDLTRVVPQGVMVLPYPFSVAASLRADLISKFKTYIGTLNSAAFMGWEEGQVMFIGATGGSYRDADGNKLYRVSLRFQCKTLGVDLKGNAITTDDWLYVLSNKHGQYKKPFTNTSSKYLYEKKDFDELMEEITTP